jgi:hypothetical protein
MMDPRTKTDLRRPPFLRRYNKPLPPPTGDEEHAMLFGETIPESTEIRAIPTTTEPPFPEELAFDEEPRR